jgi:hypothetical protein
MTDQRDIWDECMDQKPKPPSPKRKQNRHNLEATVLKECLAWLRANPRVVYTERRNTGVVTFTDGGRVAFGRKGASDIWCLIQTPLYELLVPDDPDQEITTQESGEFSVKHVEVEIKRRDGTGKLSLAQEKFQHFCREIGVPYLVATSAEDLAEQLKKMGLTN